METGLQLGRLLLVRLRDTPVVSLPLLLARSIIRWLRNLLVAGEGMGCGQAVMPIGCVYYSARFSRKRQLAMIGGLRDA